MLKIRTSILLFILCILLSYLVTNVQNEKFERQNRQMKEAQTYVGRIVSNPIQKEYSTQYLLQVIKKDNENTNISVYIQVKGKVDLEYGDEIFFEGEYKEPDGARNEKGFNYKQYLKSNRNCWNGCYKTSRSYAKKQRDVMAEDCL